MAGKKIIKLKQNENIMIDSPNESSQSSDVNLARSFDNTEIKTMREIPLNKLLNLKKDMNMMGRNKSQIIIPIKSNINIAEDEMAQSSTGNSEEAENKK
ncbi:unnamed protein product [Cercopithifilaria johnstoni]|uniref:Uncharacterized protein n=1 Tax=Cercopithifilaria johnstoni TaxID=2874296 RepID=A0A8J2LZR9_9BILA|nr:unnamed protein product [Cercopithifilaria johnstoni]